MTTIYLIRHGQASFGQDDYDQLSELGKQQASHLGKALSKRLEGFDAVALGNMQRHKQTAENCLSEMGCKLEDVNPIISSGWNEYDHQDILAQFRPEFANAAGVEKFIAAQENPKQAFEKMFNDAVNRWMEGQHDSGYVETWENFKARVLGAFGDISQQFKNAKHVAVFTSGGPISLLSQYFLGVPEQNLMQLNWTVVNCGITKVVSTGSRTFIATLNEHVHFEADYKSMLTYK